jgi:hypothetical protein
MKKLKQIKQNKKSLEKKAEELLKAYIVKRDGLYCDHCGKYQEKGLNLSHVIGRKNGFLKFNEYNVKLLCYYCHRYFWHNEPLKAMEWFKQKYPERYEFLIENQMRTDKIDINEIIEYYKGKL